MIGKRIEMRTLKAAAFSAALATLGATAMAQTAPSRAAIHSDELATVIVRHARTGTQDAQVSQRVSYADLDLATRRGARELTNRIEQSATFVCERLSALYPEGSFATQWQDQRACVGNATQGAMAQARVAIASARLQQAH